ncbi:4-carboxymuconolactone decarboxylase [Gordonia sp. SID5947]|uniref:carboxymuconolactone decarboxylase family protein n=1 Tax=Gordonia sp. SID5947 TaxID=2690315 RepID=UPI00136B64DA|nr:carboxymuconolactone decarboxylase family protein [Gordonia sp. SID5947]MYR06721.1 4-carboxymuconolactone decarboxylase [Gordonia sp. SID5947]
MLAAAHRSLYEAGLDVRSEVVGADYVAESLARSAGSDGEPLQQFVTETVWGSVWTRPGLDRRSRSLMTIGMLVALNHHAELAVHVRAGLGNGLNRDEIVEAIIHATAYCGVPAGIAAMRITQDVLIRELGERRDGESVREEAS